jgi:hypothetical protein
MRNACKVLVIKLEGNRPLRRSRHIWDPTNTGQRLVAALVNRLKKKRKGI